jgi:hypothetical protein
MESIKAMRDWYDIAKDFGPIVVGLVAAWVAFKAYKAQVEPLVDQLTFVKEQAQKDRDRREYAIAWAVLLEARRIHQSAARRVEALDSLSQPNATSHKTRREPLFISVFDILRGGRADIALMHIRHQTMVFQLVQAVDQFNAAVEVERPAKETIRVAHGSMLLNQITELRDKALALCNALERAYGDKIADPNF